jgi:hypothetical protein
LLLSSSMFGTQEGNKISSINGFGL